MYLVECYNDETLLLALGVGRQQIRRMRGKANVVGRLRKNPNALNVGMVDRDRHSENPVPMDDFRVVSNNNGVEGRIKGKTRLVILDDNLEDWIIKAFAEGKRDLKKKRLADYGLPAKPTELHRIESRVADVALTALIKDLDAAGLSHLASLRLGLGLSVKGKRKSSSKAKGGQ